MTVSFHRVSSTHPLTVIAETGSLPLIKHPYIQLYVDIWWHSLARYVFYLNLILYMLFLFFLCVFITSHEYVSRDSNVQSANAPAIVNNTNATNTTPNNTNFNLEVDNRTEPKPLMSNSGPYITPDRNRTHASASITIILAILGLIFEGFQALTKGRDYLNRENCCDLFIFTCTLFIISVALGTYNSILHVISCILIIIAALRGSVNLTHVPLFGNKFQMLLAVAGNVMTFIPVLMFFIVAFAVAFSSLLQNQEPFSHVGVAIVKIMAMSIGELDFGDIFFDEANIESHEIVAFLLFILFLGIMTISMMNLLIGVAVGDIGELSQQGEQIAFRSKVDLILQYSFMFAGISKGIQDRKVEDITLWHTLDVSCMYNSCIQNLCNILVYPLGINTDFKEEKFKSYLENLEREQD